jgi:soluble lytic murein transglycosylase-like protein
MLTVLTVPAFAGIEAGAREYEERCADYYAQQYGVDPAFVRAVIEVESAWDPSAVSSKGAMGLMQLMPATALRFGVAHPFYVHENVRGGVAYLAALRTLFRGDLRLMAAAYVAGEKAILAQGLNYSSAEVFLYVRRIRQQYLAEMRRQKRR